MKTQNPLETSDGDAVIPPQTTTSGRVLIVDSDPLQREAARELSSALGYDAEAVGDGEQALQRCNEAAPDAVLVPIDSEVADGTRTVDALKSLQSDGQLPLFPIIATSVDPSVSEQEDSQLDGVVSKPLRISSLASELSRCASQTPAATADVPEVDDSATDTR